MDKINTRINIAAAVLGHTNLGLPRPDKDKIQGLLAQPLNLESAVAAISEPWIESEAMYDTFIGEALEWVRTINKKGWKASAELWPEVFELLGDNND